MYWELVKGIRGDGNPNGALVAAGQHAVVVVGYHTLNDPFTPTPQTLYGFYIEDPWYGNGDSGLDHWPPNGFTPNSYVTIDNWNSWYYLPDTNNGSFWNNKYVSVLRASTTVNPSDNPPQTYGDYVNPVSSAQSAAPSNVVEMPKATIADAVVSGMTLHGLSDGGSLGVNLTGYTVGQIVHVESLATGFPSYDLAELKVGGVVRAAAIANELPEGYVFAAVSPVTSGFDLPSASGLARFAATYGIAGHPRLVWAWTEWGGSPFAPFIEGADARSGAPVYLSRDGRTSLRLVHGLTLAKGANR